jgi:GNAT superfamily N-acetyltransferase
MEKAVAIDVTYARAQDKSEWLPLWRAYLDFYNNPLPQEVTDTTFGRFMDAREPMVLLLAREGKEVLGFVTLVMHRSTWARTFYVYLEDLFVAEAARGKGVGRRLIEAVIEHARGRDCERVYWVTHAHNETARKLYDKLASDPGFVTYFAKL